MIYFVKCKQDKQSINSTVSKTNNDKIMLFSKREVFYRKKIKIYRKRSKQIIKQREGD